MKKLFLILAAAAMTLSFLSTANAADNAVLGLSVTFAVDQDQDLERVKEISAEMDGIDMKAAEWFKKGVNADDPDVTDGCINELKMLKDYIEQTLFTELYEIAKRRPDLGGLIDAAIQKGNDILHRIADYIGELKKLLDQDLKQIREIEAELAGIAQKANAWFEKGRASDDPQVVEDCIYELKLLINYIEATLFKELYAIAQRRPDLQGFVDAVLVRGENLMDKIRAYIAELASHLPRISIEVYPLDWVLTGVKLGAKISNVTAVGVPQHAVYNTGNVPVLVDIGYGPYKAQGIVPGFKQGTNVFITEVERGKLGMTVIPPGNRIKMVSLKPDEKSPLHFVYGAPTAVSKGVSQHSVTYEMRAYADLIKPGR